MPLAPGTRLGPYEILTPLGSGGMGEVYRARDPRLEREVAIKVIAESMVRDPRALSRFEREVKAVAALSHPNILAIHDFGVTGNISYAITELLEGETLRGRLDRSRLQWRRAVEIAIPIAEGLAAAHARGIVHRDLKPENVFLTADGQVKILDFGLARWEQPPEVTDAAAETQTGVIEGTLSYMAPEQARGERARATSDIFSLGCVLYEMLAGKRAFGYPSPAETLAAVLHRNPAPVRDFVPDLPHELERWLAHCLEKNPAQRLQSAGDLAFALKALLAAPGMPVSGSAAAIDSLAVLPFAISSDTPDAEYLADGVTETLINSLAQVAGLKVMARSTVFRYRGKDPDPLQAGRDLNVRAVVTGRVFQRGNNMVIGAEMVDVSTGLQLWGQQFRRKWADIFEIQDEISTQISNNLQLKLSSDEQRRLTRRYTEDPEAYQVYLKGRYCWNQRTIEGMRRGLIYFQQAIDKDPGYARAYAGLGDCYSMLGIYLALPPAESFPKGKAAARKALEIDTELAEAYSCLGFAQIFYDWDLLAAEQTLRQALAFNPGYPSAHQWYAMCLGFGGRLEQAITEAKLAQQLDPFSASINVSSAWPYYWGRRYDEALARFRAAAELHPNLWLTHYWVGITLALKGELSPAIAALENSAALGDSTWRYAGLGYVYGLAGRRAEAEGIIQRLQAAAGQQYVSPNVLATIFAGLGDRERVLECLQQGYQTRSWLMMWIGVDPLFDLLRDDPRFRQLLRKVGAAQ